MILQALTQYYDALNARGEIAAPGCGYPKISYALQLRENGELMQVTPLLHEVESGKKKVLRPAEDMRLPAAVKRSSGIASNFLWDNSAYLLGIVDTSKENSSKKREDKEKRAVQCFQAAAALHHELLDSINSPVARAILAFFDTWQPSGAALNLALAEVYSQITSGANLVFRVNSQYAQDDPAVCAAWQQHYDGASDAPRQQCLVTGEPDEIAAVHPSIKGVRDAQSSGAALVSFNAPAFCSYGHEQNYNAPVGRHAAFAYTTALNHLLADRERTRFIGDTTVVCWAETAEEQYVDFFDAVSDGGSAVWSENDLAAALNQLANGEPCTELGLDPKRSFYILGLAPNAARLSVRFFLKNSFGDLMKNVNAHYERLKIKRPANENSGFLPLWKLLAETVNQNARDKKPSPVMAGAAARAVWNGERYPAALLNGIMLRIRADRNVNWRRAAAIKAYYLKNTDDNCPKEVLTVGLNEASTNIPYTLGRLFSLYEAAQQAANPGINTTIKDKYFNSAASAPASIFPILGNLCQKHLRKLQPGQRIYYDKQISELKNILGETYPARLNLPQQGSFDLGYYHQTQKRFTKKEDK